MVLQQSFISSVLHLSAAASLAAVAAKQGAVQLMTVLTVLDAMQTYDALIVGSPVYYAGPAGQLCAFLDRLFYASGGRMAGKPAACIVSCRRGGASAAFDRLNKYFTINSMPVVSSQYWNQVHGSTAEQVLQDAEGMQTMRTLAHNLAWMLQNIAAGRKEGVSFPEAREPRLRTDFIRS